MSDCGRQHRYERGVEAQLGNSPDHRPLSWLCTTSRFYHTFSFTFSVHHRDACMNVILRSVQVTLVIVHVQHQHQRAAEPEAETPRAFCCFKVLLVLNRVKHSLTFLVRRKYPMAVTLMRTLWVTHTQRERERERERESIIGHETEQELDKSLERIHCYRKDDFGRARTFAELLLQWEKETDYVLKIDEKRMSENREFVVQTYIIEWMTMYKNRFSDIIHLTVV